jgi:hypothetical protein
VIVGTHRRGFAVAGGTVDGDLFAKGIVIPDYRVSRAAFPLQILRFQPDADEGENLVFITQNRVTVNDDVRMHCATVTQCDMLANHAIRPNHAISAEAGVGVDDGGGMDRVHGLSVK